MAKKYAEGRRAWGICMRSGRKMLLRDMVMDGRFPNMRVDPAWYEDRHPLEFLPKVEDPIALYRPSPEVIAGPAAAVLGVELTSPTIATVTWTPAETDITEIRSYTIFRSVDSGVFTQLQFCQVRRDFLGGIASIDHCTTQVPPAGSDKYFPDDAPVTYVDSALSAGHNYCYYVTAQPLGNNQSVGQGPPSIPSNIICVSTLTATARRLLENGGLRLLEDGVGDRLLETSP